MSVRNDAAPATDTALETAPAAAPAIARTAAPGAAVPPLISAAELHELLSAQATGSADAPPTGSADAPPAGTVRVLDVRWSLAEPSGHAEFLRGHIPGAVFVDLESELSESGSPEHGRHPVPGGVALTHSARRWGLNPGDTVVAVDGGGHAAAARLWWLLRDAGFHRVRILDGSLPAWVREGYPLETAEQRPEPGSVELHPGNSPALSLDTVGEYARDHTLIDARAAERYRGEHEPIDPVAGHIPGAVNLPTPELMDDRGHFLAPAQLRERFAAVGLALPAPTLPASSLPATSLSATAPPTTAPPATALPGPALPEPAPARPAPTEPEAAAHEYAAHEAAAHEPAGQHRPAEHPFELPRSEPAELSPVGVYCGSGVTASAALFALELVGVTGALFPGSWSQWSQHPDLPVATGPAGSAPESTAPDPLAG